MEKQTEKLLELNGRVIYFLSVDGTYWIAVKPICEALGIAYKRQHDTISNDETLCQLSSLQGIVAADGKLREMFCLPEKYVYGWLFSIRSESPGLKEYKLKCYDLLYDHFHGSLTRQNQVLADGITQRREVLAGTVAIEEKIAELEDRLIDQSELYAELEDQRAKLKSARRQLRTMDEQLLTGQMSMF